MSMVNGYISLSLPLPEAEVTVPFVPWPFDWPCPFCSLVRRRTFRSVRRSGRPFVEVIISRSNGIGCMISLLFNAMSTMQLFSLRGRLWASKATREFGDVLWK